MEQREIICEEMIFFLISWSQKRTLAPAKSSSFKPKGQNAINTSKVLALFRLFWLSFLSSLCI